MTITSVCGASAAADWSLLRVTIGGDSSTSGIYERSSAEPLRNGRPHWIKQNEGPSLGVDIKHLFYVDVYWVISSAPRGYSDVNSIAYVSSAAAYAPPTTITSFNGRSVSITPVCPIGTYSVGTGGATQCRPCGAYQFSPPGSTSSSACACAPGAGLTSSGTCAPCTGDSFRASSAENAPCNACPTGSFALDGAQAPAGCNTPSCSQITV